MVFRSETLDTDAPSRPTHIKQTVSRVELRGSIFYRPRIRHETTILTRTNRLVTQKSTPLPSSPWEGRFGVSAIENQDRRVITGQLPHRLPYCGKMTVAYISPPSSNIPTQPATFWRAGNNMSTWQHIQVSYFLFYSYNSLRPSISRRIRSLDHNNHPSHSFVRAQYTTIVGTFVFAFFFSLGSNHPSKDEGYRQHYKHQSRQASEIPGVGNGADRIKQTNERSYKV